MPDTTSTSGATSDNTTSSSDTSDGDATSTDTGTTTEGDGQPAELGDAGKRALAAERERAKAAEQRAKDLERQVEELRRAQMSDQEKAIDEARAQARAEALAESGTKIARSEIRAAAAGRLGDKQLDTLLEGLDLKAFLDDDGEVDTKKVRAFVDGIAPAGGQGRHMDLGQGARGSAQLGTDMNSVIRRAAGRR